MTPPPIDTIPLSGRRALITGGTTGVGRATAHLLASHGCRVFICGRDPRHLDDAIRSVREKGGAIDGVSADISTTDGVLTVFKAADAFLGGLDIGIVNAGVGCKGELTTMTHEECRYVLDVNLGASIACCLEAFRRMSGAGGHVVLTGSMSADVFDTRSSVYVATKCAIRGFATCLRKEANPLGIKVSLIEPGSIGSDMVDETPEQQQRMREELKMLRAEDVANAILFMLCQPPWCDVIQLKLRPHLQLI